MDIYTYIHMYIQIRINTNNQIYVANPLAQDRRKLLQNWVSTEGNRNACESRVILTKENASIYQGKRELVSIRDMIMVKKWPLEKVQGVVAKGGGIKDPYAPHVAALTQYWVETGASLVDEQATRQVGKTEVNAQTTAGGVGALFDMNMAPKGSAHLTPEQLKEITDSTTPPSEGTLDHGF